MKKLTNKVKLLLYILLLLPGMLFSQINKLGIPLTQLVSSGEVNEINLILRGNTARIIQHGNRNNWHIGLSGNNMVSVIIPVEDLTSINSLDFIEFVEFSSARPQLLNDVMLQNNNIVPVHQGAGLLKVPNHGEDVIVGMIDTGLELDHPDFQNEDGTTRVLALWDQTQSETFSYRVPQPYGYGQEWTYEDINDGITNHQDQVAHFGHGTTVSGVALGNGSATGNYKGVASNADIIVVASDLSRLNWSQSVAEAVDYIFTRADEIGKPAVVNISLGSYTGSHDGLDGPALFIDSLLDAHPGRVVVSAAGNSGAYANYHLKYQANPADTSFTWFKYNSSSVLGTGAVFFEAWADTADFNNVSYSIGADLISPAYDFKGYVPFRNAAENLNTLMVDTLFWQGQQLGIVQTWISKRGGQYLLQVVVFEPFSTNYNWRFATTGEGTFDVWSSSSFGFSNMVDAPNLPSESEFPALANYKVPDNLQSIVDSWNCSPKVITVGNYTNRDSFLNYNNQFTTYDVVPGEISVNSSRGPTRDNRLKPDIAASGDITISTGSFPSINSLINTNPEKVSFTGMHYVNGGTSMASPVVTGIAALFLSKCPAANYQMVKDAITSTGIPDQFTGELPNYSWGNGKVNAFAALNSVAQNVTVSLNTTTFCPGEEVFATASPGLENYVWSSGITGQVGSFQQAGAYRVSGTDAAGCIQHSDNFNLYLLPQPSVPLIAEGGDTLFSSPASEYQWYLNGQAISNETDAFIIPQASGSYQVETFNEDGCPAISENYMFYMLSAGTLSTTTIKLFPNPSSGTLRVEGLPAGEYQMQVMDLQGKVLKSVQLNSFGEALVVDLTALRQGMYMVKCINADKIAVNFKLLIEK